MIRLLEVPNKKILVILVLRQTFGYTLAEANRIATRPPQDLPELDEYEEKRLRKALEEAGCTLGKEFCVWDYQHASFYPPKDYDGPVCGSMYAFTTICGERMDPLPPRVHSGLSDEERTEMISKVTCPRCREALANWGYLEEDRV